LGFVTDMAAKRRELSPSATAFIDFETGRSWSFLAVDAWAARLGQVLLGAGLDPGERVAILCHNRPEFFVALFACQKAGLVLAPLNWRQPIAELSPVLASVKPTAILHDDKHAGQAEALAQEQGLQRFSIEAGFDELINGAKPLPPRQVPEDEPWYLLCTSGTTGLPKAVIQTARMGIANAANVAQAVGLTAADRSVNYLPLFHTGGINLYTLPLFLWGGTSTVLRGFDPDAILDLIKKDEISQFFGVPTIYQSLSGHPNAADVDFSKLAGMGCGGAALPHDAALYFADRGRPILPGFGMTETGPMGFLADRGAAMAKPGTIGRPQMMTEARIAGAVEDGPAEGELELRGPTITPGYFGNEEATRAAFTEDGWLRSGDVARRDADGDYFIVDRIKDMFISGGENVYPAEVERVLLTHEAILDAAVIGVADETWGEVGTAFLITKTGQALDPAALTAWCRERLAAYKVPKRFIAVDDFPRTAAGKVRKPLLREMEQ
jgi:fatty-acyl-CoA synthase